MTFVCSSCGAENEAGRKFCGECGAALAVACPECASPNPPTVKFCGECGVPLAGAAVPAVAPPAAERRLVTVLFADLVGFTSLSEASDAEDARELLTRYFDACRRLIELYGGTVEKFIGDAVMAVWGAPTAQEDDAERAVRTALELVAAIPDLDGGLRARAGVLTGEAAVTLGAEGQGMVAGDLVNTASRVQSVAEPGHVLVGDSTRRATEASIAYDDAGACELKGKVEPVQLWRALRVTAGRAGALKSAGLEPPFVGRERELRLVKELFHASAEEGRANLVSVTGIAGIGKSRLGWELFKYIDGLADTMFWWRGRCLAYGEGVTYWALAEMVRTRADIVEGEQAESARPKLTAALEPYIPDPEERAWIEPRLAHLLGLEDGAARDREDLFAAWRLYFERLSEYQPAILVFEDMQWADVSLLEFVEYLLEWSRSHPLFVLTLARPELGERHPTWGAGKRNFTALTLEPLSPAGMEELLDGFVPGLPGQLRSQIMARAEGVPLYAVETVRMLLDRGLLEQHGNEYRPTGPVDALEVPETLHALIAARLDGLAPGERRLLQDASVLGKTFTKAALAAVNGASEERLEPLLASLVRKEVLGVQADPRSPERGQYGFLQELLRRVAYETLAKAERKARHLAAASYLEQSWGPTEQEIAEVVSSHYLAAFEAAPDAEDAGEIKAKARAMLARAGERAESLAANDEALRYFEQAAQLAEDPLDEGELREQAGQAAWAAGQSEPAAEQFARALALFEANGATHPAARVSARLGEVDWRAGRLTEALERLETAFAVLSADEPDADVAALAAQLGRLHFFEGNLERATERIEAALSLSESLRLPEVLSQALTTAGIIAASRRRPEQSLAFLKHALDLALENGLPLAAFRAAANFADQLDRRDRYEEALEQHRRNLALARRLGDRTRERLALAEVSWCLYMTGSWDEALASAGEIPEHAFAYGGTLGASVTLTDLFIARGELDEARRCVERIAHFRDSADVQDRSAYETVIAALCQAEGRHEDALTLATGALETAKTIGLGSIQKRAFAIAIESAFQLARVDEAEALVARIESLAPGEQLPFLRAQAARFRARLAAARGESDNVQPRFMAAEALFREFGFVFWLAVTQLEHGVWLVEQARREEAEPLLGEAREIFERLEARPWLERLACVARPEALVE